MNLTDAIYTLLGAFVIGLQLDTVRTLRNLAQRVTRLESLLNGKHTR